MTRWICVTCGVQYPESAEPPIRCPICDEERQYVGWAGQRWTTLEEMQTGGYRNEITSVEESLTSVITTPAFAINQRAFLVQTPGGNLLWDCITHLDAETVDAFQKLGGVQAIAISHPHYYSAIVEWSDAFDGAPIYIHAADRQWVQRSSPNVVLWEGVTTRPLPDIELICLGGHFDGGTVAHWQAGASGNGIVLSGDILQVVMDRRWVSFMYSYPNIIPLSAKKVARIADLIRPYRYDRVYGAFQGRQVIGDAHACVERSAERYLRHLRDD